MKKNIFMAFIALFLSVFVFAQVSTTPEVPRNYKPKPKELLPMPDSLTTEGMFPALGTYIVGNKNGDSTTIDITLDENSKGVIWLNGLPEGKFKAELKASPATYRIPSQKTLTNDPTASEAAEAAVEEAIEGKPAKKAANKSSGKSVSEGTLIYDKDANTIYINLGAGFNETEPAKIFNGLMTTTETVEEPEATISKKAKKPVNKGKNYIGPKAVEIVE